MSPFRTLVFLAILLPLAAAAAVAGAEARKGRPMSKNAVPLLPAALTCEYEENPLGIDAARPRLGWRLEAADPNDRGQRQTAYRILAATTAEKLCADHADLWDSRQVKSAASVHVPYAGKALRSGQRVWWKVRVWDRDGKPSPWSEPAWWEMGLLNPGDWGAQWITGARPVPATDREHFEERPAPLFRRGFRVSKPVERARVYVSGLGYYELRLNGEKVGNHVLDPAWTDYRKRVSYAAYDVTRALRQGENALGAMLGSGWYDPLPLPLFNRFNLREHLLVGRPRLILRLEIRYTDGSSEAVVSDGSWRTGDGPILKNSVYLGELYDARREQRGWARPGFDDSGWQAAQVAAEPVGPLEAQSLPPVRQIGSYPARKVTQPKPGVYVFDLEQNMTGWVRLKVRGPAGTRVTLRYGELLYPDGTLNPMTSVMGQIKNSRVSQERGGPPTAWQTDAYVLKGEGLEAWSPRFTYHGFRYVEVTGYPGEPPLDAVEGLPVRSAVRSAGDFACSNPMFNQLQQTVRRTLEANLVSVQSDCPHREKLGYGGDIVATSDMAMLNYDMARFYAKTVRDFADAVRPNGGFTETAPYVGIADAGLGEGSGPVGWGTAHPLLAWQLYQYYGDRRLMDEQYPAAARWTDLLQSKAKDGILENGISDHESLVPKPVALTGTAFYYYNAALVARMAKILGRREDAARYGKLAQSVKEAFNRRFLQPGTGRYDTGTQACQAFALFLGLVPEKERAAALRVLTEDVEKRGGHLSTGIFGTKYMLHALSDLGRTDTAYRVADQREFPGWGWMLANGATTLWEHWEFSDNTFSHNHPMFGSVSEWFFRSLAGIAPDEEAAAWDRAVVRPRPVADLRWAKAHHDTVRGRISTEWRREGEEFTLKLAVPPGMTATVHVPTRDADSVTESARPAERAPGVEFLWTEGGAAVYRVGSGRYTFVSSLGGG